MGELCKSNYKKIITKNKKQILLPSKSHKEQTQAKWLVKALSVACQTPSLLAPLDLCVGAFVALIFPWFTI